MPAERHSHHVGWHEATGATSLRNPQYIPASKSSFAQSYTEGRPMTDPNPYVKFHSALTIAVAPSKVARLLYGPRKNGVTTDTALPVQNIPTSIAHFMSIVTLPIGTGTRCALLQ